MALQGQVAVAVEAPLERRVLSLCGGDAEEATDLRITLLS
jgi:hypothetical protein